MQRLFHWQRCIPTKLRKIAFSTASTYFDGFVLILNSDFGVDGLLAIMEGPRRAIEFGHDFLGRSAIDESAQYLRFPIVQLISYPPRKIKTEPAATKLISFHGLANHDCSPSAGVSNQFCLNRILTVQFSAISHLASSQVTQSRKAGRTVVDKD